MQSGLSHFWESVLVLTSVSAIYPGVSIAMLLRNMHIKAAVKAKFFAALTGMFLYISLARMFPAMQVKNNLKYLMEIEGTRGCTAERKPSLGKSISSTSKTQSILASVYC